MAKIRGIETTSFKGTDGAQVEGTTFHISESIDPKRGQGERGDRFFLTKAKMAALDFTPAVGQTVDILYNRYGKVAIMKLLSEDDVEIEM